MYLYWRHMFCQGNLDAMQLTRHRQYRDHIIRINIHHGIPAVVSSKFPQPGIGDVWEVQSEERQNFLAFTFRHGKHGHGFALKRLVLGGGRSAKPA